MVFSFRERFDPDDSNDGITSEWPRVASSENDLNQVALSYSTAL